MRTNEITGHFLWGKKLLKKKKKLLKIANENNKISFFLEIVIYFKITPVCIRKKMRSEIIEYYHVKDIIISI